MTNRNSHFAAILVERRGELLKRLKENPMDSWPKVKARFAFDFGLRELKVEEYFRTIKTAGLLDE